MSKNSSIGSASKSAAARKPPRIAPTIADDGRDDEAARIVAGQQRLRDRPSDGAENDERDDSHVEPPGRCDAFEPCSPRRSAANRSCVAARVPPHPRSEERRWKQRFAELKTRLAEIHDLRRTQEILFWDQTVMMPPGGGSVRGHQVTTLDRIAHEKFVSDEIGKLLDELSGYEQELDYDSDDASLIRTTRRDWEKARRVPAELAAEMTGAAADAPRRLGEGAGRERLRALPPPPRARGRAEAPLRRLLRRLRRAVRRPPRRLRAGDEDRRGAPGLRRPEGRARAADRRDRLGGRRRRLHGRARGRSTRSTLTR